MQTAFLSRERHTPQQDTATDRDRDSHVVIQRTAWSLRDSGRRGGDDALGHGEAGDEQRADERRGEAGDRTLQRLTGGPDTEPAERVSDEGGNRIADTHGPHGRYRDRWWIERNTPKKRQHEPGSAGELCVLVWPKKRAGRSVEELTRSGMPRTADLDRDRYGTGSSQQIEEDTPLETSCVEQRDDGREEMDRLARQLMAEGACVRIAQPRTRRASALKSASLAVLKRQRPNPVWSTNTSCAWYCVYTHICARPRRVIPTSPWATI